MSIEQSKQYRISRWRGEFIDPATEHNYLQHAEPETVRHLTTALIVWGLLLLMFLGVDWASMGDSREFYLAASLRIANVLLLFILAVLVHRYPVLATAGWPVTLVAMVGYLLFFMYPQFTPIEPVMGFAMILLTLLSVYVFVPNRILLNSLIALTGITGMLITLALNDASRAEVIYRLMLMSWPTIIGYSAALRIGSGSRRAYALLMQAGQINQSLSDEISRRKHLEIELKHQALTDPLTGLSNRRQYELLFNRELDRCKRHNTGMVMGIIDLDHFKQINDRFGHDFGDQVLCTVSDALKSPLRHSDILGRYGGEEFVLILPETTLEQGLRIAERMRDALASAAIIYDGEVVKVTATFALTRVLATDMDLNQIIRRADESLYAGKEQGRDRIIVNEAA